MGVGALVLAIGGVPGPGVGEEATVLEGGGDALGRLVGGDRVAGVADDEDRWGSRSGDWFERVGARYRPVRAGQRERSHVGAAQFREHRGGAGRLRGERLDVGCGGGLGEVAAVDREGRTEVELVDEPVGEELEEAPVAALSLGDGFVERGVKLFVVGDRETGDPDGVEADALAVAGAQRSGARRFGELPVGLLRVTGDRAVGSAGVEDVGEGAVEGRGGARRVGRRGPARDRRRRRAPSPAGRRGSVRRSGAR